MDDFTFSVEVVQTLQDLQTRSDKQTETLLAERHAHTSCLGVHTLKKKKKGRQSLLPSSVLLLYLSSFLSFLRDKLAILLMLVVL